MSFDYADYVKHASKYEHYKTARVAAHVFTNDGIDDLEKGQFVAVRFMHTAYNGLRHRVEPVYGITANGKTWGVMFASSLADFVL